MTLRIRRSAEGAAVVFTLSGRIEADRVPELQGLLASEGSSRPIALDLEDVDLVDRDTVRFLARCSAEGVQLVHCPGYIREWIVKETEGPHRWCGS